jgi:outer membrane receptor protein involved in Fe transport
MKNHVRILLIVAALGSAAKAAPFLAIGDGAELFVTGALGIRSDDNIFLAADTVDPVTKKSLKVDDIIFDINPGVELTFGKNAPLSGALTLVDAFSNYSDRTNLNTNLFSADFRGAYEDAKLKLKFNTGYHELNQNTVDVQGLTRRNEFVIGSSGEVAVSPLTSISAGVNFNHTNYRRTNYGDSDDLNVPVNFYYKWTPKLDLSAGYRYRTYETTIGLDSTDHFFNVGARGEFSPKLTGQMAIGVNTRKFGSGATTGTVKSGDTETLPGVDASFTYAITPKTGLQFGASNDYGTAPQGQQQKNLSFYGNASIAFDANWSFNGGLSYRAIDYYTRTDDYFEGTVGASYLVNTYVKLTASYVHRNNDSDLAASTFKNNVFSLAASLRY